MALFGREHQPRQVRRGADSTPSIDRGPSIDQTTQVAEAKHRKWWKVVLASILGLLLIVVLSLGGLYFYLKVTPLAGEGGGRINILVLGVDQVADLADTMMIVSVNTRSNDPQVAVVSIPRDLWVEIPEFGDSKINAAYPYGENNAYPGGGAVLAKDTIEQNLDIPIHYYATLDFAGFEELIDAVGGLDIEVKEPIDDPFYPDADYSGFEPFSIEAGLQHMDGATALKYARSRQTTTDFDRAARQQQVLLGLTDRLADPVNLLNWGLIKAARQTIDEHVVTDLSFWQMAKLALLLRNEQSSEIGRHVIDTSNFLVPACFGCSELVPRSGDFDEISQFIENIFSQTANNLPENQR